MSKQTTDLALIIDGESKRFDEVSCKAPGINFEAEKGFAVQILSGNEFTRNLALSNPDSLRAAVTNISAIGISLNPALKQAYLVPRDGKICLDISYMGLLHIAIESGAVEWGQAVIVRKNDVFEMQEIGTKPIHKYNPFSDDRGEIVGCYAVVKVPNAADTMNPDFLTTAIAIGKIYEVRNRSEAWKRGQKGPWKTDEEEMIKKGLALDTRIPTPTGWTTMGDIEVGCTVFDRYGKVVSVTDTSEVKHIKCFRVEFSNGESIICDDEHKWVARTGLCNAWRKPFEVMTINDMHAAKLNGQSVTVPIQGALDLPEAQLPIDPYLFGYWIGDGTARRPQITCSSEDLENVKSSIISAGYKLGSVRSDGRSNAFSVGITGGMLEELRALNVLQNKHIPEIYLRGSVDQRKALLAGILDSDGHLEKKRGRAMFCSVDERISKAVYELAASLGETPWIKSSTARGFGLTTTAYNVLWQPSFCCFRLQRKAENYRKRKISQYRSIRSIEIVDSVPTRCIAVTGESSTYLAGDGMIPTHNTVIKNAFKYWPKKQENKRLAEAIQYMNTDGGEGIAFAQNEPKNITPASPDQQIAITDRLRELKKEFSDLAPFFKTKYSQEFESVHDLTEDQAVAVLAFIQKRAA